MHVVGEFVTIWKFSLHHMCSYLGLFMYFLSSSVGAHVNTRDGQQRSPLHWTAIRGNVEVSKLLLEKGEFTFFSELYD